MSVLLSNAKVPEGELRTKPVLSWSQQDVALWLGALGLERYAAGFEDAEIDGLALFDVTEDELEKENLLSSLGARKKFLRARAYLSAGHNVLTLRGEPVHELGRAREQAAAASSSARLAAPLADAGPHKDDIDDEQLANIAKFQKPLFGKMRNVTGGATLAVELGLNMVENIHPAVHLCALVPGGLSALMGYWLKIKL